MGTRSQWVESCLSKANLVLNVTSIAGLKVKITLEIVRNIILLPIQPWHAPLKTCVPVFHFYSIFFVCKFCNEMVAKRRQNNQSCPIRLNLIQKCCRVQLGYLFWKTCPNFQSSSSSTTLQHFKIARNSRNIFGH